MRWWFQSADGLWEKSAESASELRNIRQLTLPNYNYAPSCFLEIDDVSLISLLIPSKFVLPEFNIALREVALIAADVPMPETPVNKDYGLATGEYYIGLAR